MSLPTDTIYQDVGIRCLYCGQSQLSPKENIDNWNCNHCFSGLISFRMLVNLIPRNLYNEILSRASKKSADRPCPICQHPLCKANVSRRETMVELELCQVCKLFWFEGGAIVQLVKLAGVKPGPHPEPPRVGIHARQPERVVQQKFPPPWATFFIFLACSTVSAFSNAHPRLLEQFGFLAANPLRLVGLTWFSSLALNSPNQAWSLISFLFLGSQVENRLGKTNFLVFCVSVVLLSRMTCLISVASYPEPVTGCAPLAFSVLVFSLLLIPYRQLLYPEQRWKSPVNALQWTGAVLTLFFIVFVLGDIMSQLFQEAVDPSAPAFVLPLVGSVSLSVTQVPYLVAAGLGACWYFASQQVARSSK